MSTLKVVVIAVLVLNGGYSLISWLSSPSEPEYVAPAISYDVPASTGFDLSKLTGLVKDVRSGQELERKINKKSGINNLDLNADNKVDYIRVEEFGDYKKNNIGYSLTAQPTKAETQEIAAITIERNAENAEIQVVGNEQIYGEGAIYNTSTPVERAQNNAVTESSHGYRHHNSYFYPHSLWLSPFFFGFYPSYYSYYPIVGRRTYLSNTRGYSSSFIRKGRNSHQSKSNNKISNPNKNKSASKGIKRSLRKPTSTQKKFLATNKASRTRRSGGFGRNRSSRSRTSSSRSIRSNYSRSRSYSYGGK